MIAQLVRARTQTSHRCPVNSTRRSKRAPFGASPTHVRPMHPITFKGGAQIIDLMPSHDPEIGLVVRRISDCMPMRDGDGLYPLDPDRIVDVTELVDVLGQRQ